MAIQQPSRVTHEAGKTSIPTGVVGQAPDLSDIFEGEKPKTVENVTVGAPRAEEFKKAAEPEATVEPREVKPPLMPTAEIADFAPELGSPVFYWQEREINHKRVLVPIPGILVWRSPVHPDKWRVTVFLDTGKISDRMDVVRSDRPTANCWTLKS